MYVQYMAIRNHTCCPCIHLSIAGPYVSFGGSVLTDKYIFQSFTNYIHLGGNPFVTSEIYETAKIFGIFRNALQKLRSGYAQSYNPETRDHSRLLPRPTYQPDSLRPEKPLVFERHFMPDENYRISRRALFHATYGGEAVLVKFSETYSEVAHRALADADLAPKLYFHTLLKGGIHMVIMEYIAGRDAYQEFAYRELPQVVVDKVKVALRTLHDMGFVHGDIRRANILAKNVKVPRAASESGAVNSMDSKATVPSYEAYVTNFDHIGRADVDRYSPFLNTSIAWPQGMNRWWLMEKRHDEEMLENITRPGLHPDSVFPYNSY